MVTIDFTNHYSEALEMLTQWNANQTLMIRGLSTQTTPVIAFSNRASQTAVAVQARTVTGGYVCDIPNGLLTKPYTIYVDVRVSDGTGVKSIERGRIRVRPTSKPDDYEYVENITLVDITSFIADINTVKSEFNSIKSMVGGPSTAGTKAAMTDTSKVYVYTGSETGMVNGNWYYHDGTNWVSGGVYNAIAVDTDKTLSVDDMAADAAAAGSIIEVGSTQPSSEANKLWIDPSADEIEIPEMSDLKIVEDKVDDLKSALDNDALIFKDLAPAAIDHLVTAGMYRLSISTSSGSSTLPEKFVGTVGELVVYPVLGSTYSAVQMIIDGNKQLFIRYVFDLDSGINPASWIMLSEQEFNKYKDYVSIQVKNQILSPTYTTGKFIVHNGNIDTNSQFQYSAPIELNENDDIIVYAKGYNQGVAMISECDSSGGYIRPIVISIDSNMHYYTYTATHHCYAIACGAINGMSVSCNRFSALFENLYSSENVSGLNVPVSVNWNDGFISYTGKEYSSTDGRCKKSSVINVKAGYKIYVKAYFNGTNISIIARKNKDNTYTPLVISESGKTDYSYIPTEDMDIVVSSDARYEYYVRIVYPVSDKEKYSFSNMAMFETFGVVGDSFASGALMTSESAGYTKYNKSWGQILARELGATCINFSKGGLTTGDWLEDDKGLSLMLDSDPQELYLLMLGINDAYHLTNAPITPLGTIDDIKQDYTQNPVSFYGNYGRIIDQIKNHAPNAKLILFTVDEYGTETYISPNKSSINSAIEEIATHYGIPCLKQSEYWYFRSEYYLDNMLYSHPTAPVYSGMATAIRKMIEQAMMEYFDYFADAFMY